MGPRQYRSRLGGDPAADRCCRAIRRAPISPRCWRSTRIFLADAGVDPRIDPRRRAAVRPRTTFYPFTEARGRDALGQWPRPAETQPISFARADAPPMLLMHGTADTVVQAATTASGWRRSCAALGAPVELKLYPGKSHIDTIKSLSPGVPRIDPGAGRQHRLLAPPDPASHIGAVNEAGADELESWHGTTILGVKVGGRR